MKQRKDHVEKEEVAGSVAQCYEKAIGIVS